MRLEWTRAGEADIPVIFGLAKGLVEQYEDLSRIDCGRVFPWMERKISDSIGQYTCVRVDGEKAAWFRFAEGEIDDLYVLPPFQGRGIGTAVLERCIAMTDRPLFLYVFVKNVRAVALYKRMGFSVAEQISPTRVIMRRG